MLEEVGNRVHVVYAAQIDRQHICRRLRVCPCIVLDICQIGCMASDSRYESDCRILVVAILAFLVVLLRENLAEINADSSVLTMDKFTERSASKLDPDFLILVASSFGGYICLFYLVVCTDDSAVLVNKNKRRLATLVKP